MARAYHDIAAQIEESDVGSTPEERRKVALLTCAHSSSKEEARLVLDMLGLTEGLLEDR